MYVGGVQILRAMQVGARAYLLKNLLDELLDIIRRARRQEDSGSGGVV